MLMESELPRRRGRGARINTPNRFEPVHVEPDPAELEEDELRQVPTTLYRDATKTALAHNDSPDVGFDYSLNPYRGCEHGCVYCLSGDTLILMGDGSTTPLRHVRVGDVVYGTERRGWCRRYVRTRVSNHWSTEKQAYRITLADGTQLVASSDHRFLTERGWKHVIGAEQGAQQRPHLTLKNALMGVGGSQHTPVETAQYRQGYLCGVIPGDGHLGVYRYDRPGRRNGDQWQFRLTLVDAEAMDRTARFLNQAGVSTTGFCFQSATTSTKAMDGIRTHARAAVEDIEQEIAWPSRPSSEWWRGFLAGIFDAEGSYSAGILRIANTDPDILKCVDAGLTHYGFDFTHDVHKRGARPVCYVRLLGGLVHHLRFFHLIDPAIRRRVDIEGQAIKSNADLRVVQIDPLGEQMPMFDITTGTGDFIANGVVSHNCYARPSHEYLGFSAGLDFETRIVVKEDAPELLAKAFTKRSWVPQVVALAGNTDVYQPVERRLGLTRRCLEVFLRYRNPVSIITKSRLILRDLDVLQQLARLNLVTVSVSITTLRADVAGAMEPRAARPSARLGVVEELSRAGIPVGVLVAPVVPGLTDEEMPPILEAAAANGAQRAGYILMRLPGPVKPLFLDWLRDVYPDRYGRVVRRLEELRGGTLNDPRFGSRMRGEGEWADLFSELFRQACRRLGLNQNDVHLETGLFRRIEAGQYDLFDDA